MIYENTLYQLTSDTVKELLTVPETGMGYQVIQGLAGKPLQGFKRRETFIVMNATYAMVAIEPPQMNDLWRLNNTLQRLKSKLELNAALPFIQVVNFKLISGIRTVRQVQNECQDVYVKKGRKSGGQGAVDAIAKNANGVDIYVRLSAFADDKRIDKENQRLLPGSFTTLYKDYHKCLTFDDSPNDRYALPSDNKIEHAFFIRPLYQDTVQEGIVQPDFGKCGGGEEAYFKNGTGPETHFDTKPYGELPDAAEKIPGRIDFPPRIGYGFPFNPHFPGGWDISL